MKIIIDCTSVLQRAELLIEKPRPKVWREFRPASSPRRSEHGRGVPPFAVERLHRAAGVWPATPADAWLALERLRTSRRVACRTGDCAGELAEWPAAPADVQAHRLRTSRRVACRTGDCAGELAEWPAPPANVQAHWRKRRHVACCAARSCPYRCVACRAGERADVRPEMQRCCCGMPADARVAAAVERLRAHRDAATLPAQK